MTLPPPAALRVAVRAARARPRAVVLVDGRSGAGKSTFGTALARRAGARLLRLDDLYPGWDGLPSTAELLVDRVLVARRSGTSAAVRRWDWAADRPGERFTVPADGPLVVEGCGALTRRSAGLADLAVWIELSASDRRRRALGRDGEGFAPHWERWARQERLLLARDDPARLADLVVDGRRYPQRVFGERTADAQYA